MAADLATLDNLPLSQYGPEDDNKDDFTSGVKYLPRLAFYTNASLIVKKKQFPENHFALIKSKDEKIDLGESFTGMVFAYRYKALDFREEKKVKVYYDPKSPEFLEVKKDAERDRPKNEKSKTMYGVEFLIYIRDHGFVTLLCASKTLKNEAKKIFGLMRPQYITFGHELREAGDYAWEAPKVSVFSGSFDIDMDPTKLVKVVTEFTQPTKPEVQDAEETNEGAVER